MNSLHRLLAFCAVGCSLPACGDEVAEVGDAERQGRFQIPLVSTGTSGGQYHLSGVFQISGTAQQNVVADGTMQALDVTLQVGEYTVGLAAGWQLERIEGATNTPVDATLLTGPQQFTIAENALTQVAFAFQLQGESVVFGEGTLRLVVDVEDQLFETSCTDGMDNDSDGLVDCADPECAGNSACLTPVENCTDGIDNDGDMKVDCADPDCAPDPACAVPVCGDGTAQIGEFCFLPPEIVPAGPLGGPVTRLASADFNGDGRQDLVAATASTGRFVALVSTATGFVPGPVQVGPPLVELLIGDFDGLGAPDVAAITQGGESVRVFSVNPAGGMNQIASFGGGPIPVAAVAGDLNGDGLSDLVVASGAEVRVLHSLGGGFVVVMVLPVPGQVSSLAIADFNGDARLDVAVGRRTPGEVRVFNGDPGGGLSPAAQLFPVPGSNQLTVLATADVDNNGSPDIVAGGLDPLAASLLNIGGGFSQVVFPAPPLTSLALAPLDYDNKVDLLGGGNGGYAAFLGIGDGSFNQAQIFPTSTSAVIAADVTGDGLADIIAGAGGPALEVSRSNP
jgi:hypothetical protein